MKALDNHPHVAILFEEPAINDLLAELMSARGIKARILAPGEALLAEERLITEPQYLTEVPQTKLESCLVIGNKEALQNSPGIKLARPLTETKILAALDRFLA